MFSGLTVWIENLVWSCLAELIAAMVKRVNVCTGVVSCLCVMVVRQLYTTYVFSAVLIRMRI